MEFKNRKASCTEAKQMDMVFYLSSLGYEPAKISNNDYWYLSPLRIEKTPSFKVSRRLNRWYDHGIGKGGNLIDFAILYNDCTVGEFLQALDTESSFHMPIEYLGRQDPPEAKRSIIVGKEGPLKSPALYRYLYQRRIPAAVAKQFCCEVIY
jgi:DNA primase